MQHDSESFDLPEWGTEGAPPAPVDDVDSGRRSAEQLDVVLDITPELVRLSGPVPTGFVIRSIFGLISADGSATVSDSTSLAAATAAARDAALDRLSTDATTMGATVVSDISLTVAVRLNDVIVTAYGSAFEAAPPRMG